MRPASTFSIIQLSNSRGLIDSDVMVHMPGGKLWTQIDEEWAVKTIGSVKRICKIQLFEDFFQGI